MRDIATQRLINAGKQLDALISRAGGILSLYVQPDGLSSDEALNQLIYLFDGPEQRAAQKAWKEAVELTPSA